MANFFLDNPDIQFHFARLDLREIVSLTEDGYVESKKFKDAPVNYDDAVENYRKVLEVVGDLAANRIAPRAADVDREGAKWHDGTVTYAAGTRKNLDELSKADLMGMILPRQYGGLNFPFTVYMMAVEMISRADASLMNLYGLQDIADTIKKFGTEAQRAEFLPKFCTGEYTGAMALTEPDAGSDLQAVKLQAHQDGKGQWFLRGVKRFITNGSGHVLVVLARSEPGTKDGRGLSLFACYGKDGVVVRRIENKLGIHGSPTCELQFNDVPAQLVGSRKFGLIKYVIELMYRARMGIAAQALGISQAAYGEALAYAKDRVQFNKPIYAFPAVSNILITMRVTLEMNRSLFYHTAQCVDRKEKLEELIEKRKEEGKHVTDLVAQLRRATALAALLTPLTKLVLTESANKVTYDALQIHGGTGYMKEFRVERLARDARITNIYEGTSQLQVVAAAGSVINDILRTEFEKKEAMEYPGSLSQLAAHMKEIRQVFLDSLRYVVERKDSSYQEVAAKDLVDLYGYLVIGYLLLDEAETDSRKIFVANRYILDSLAAAKRNAECIKNGMYADILHADKILNG